MLGDEDSVLVVEADGASVEGLVVQRTQGQTVVFCVRAGGGVPADVGGFDTQTRVFQHCIEAADGASVLVDAQDGVTEGGIAASPEGRHNPGHADGVEQILVDRLGEVVVEDPLGDLVNESGVGLEPGDKIRRKATVGTGFKKHALGWVVLSISCCQILV